MMKQRIFSLFLSVMMIFSSMEMPVFAEETENEEAIELQTGEVLTDESHVIESTVEITSEIWQEERRSEEEVTEVMSSDSVDEEIPESVITDQIEETNQEQNTFETVNDTELQEESLTTASESIETGNKMTETEQEETTIVQETTEPEEIETEEDEIKAESSSGLNEAVKNKILSFKRKYPNKVKNPNNLQCLGFVQVLATDVFGCNPGLSKIVREARDGQKSNGWTCYHVKSDIVNDVNSFCLSLGKRA